MYNIIATVLVGLILVGAAGSLIGSAARDCFQDLQARQAAQVAQLEELR